jgi:hypothetical protein
VSSKAERLNWLPVFWQKKCCFSTNSGKLDSSHSLWRSTTTVEDFEDQEDFFFLDKSMGLLMKMLVAHLRLLQNKGLQLVLLLWLQ